MFKYLRPAHYLAFGYLSYILFGTVLLMSPLCSVDGVAFIDHLFTATSAVSTTGLVTLDPASTYNYFGELILIILFQLGGLGYMTTTSYVILAANRKFSPARFSVLKTAFSLPKTIGIAHFVRHMLIYTFTCELIGALFLYVYFKSAGIENAAWNAVFHSVSAFCTAGFSLFTTGFENFRGHSGVNLVLAALSILGGIGFIVVTDIWEKIKDRSRKLTFTSYVIITMTSLFLLYGTVLLYFFEPSFSELPIGEKILVSFFQTMTATTTVGFNTVPIANLSLPAIMVIYFLMFFGASPAGTGGGLKLTTLTALIGEFWSHLRGYDRVCLLGKELPLYRVRAASITLFTYLMVLGSGLFLLTIAMPAAQFERLFFEAVSAIGTVGLSMGLTAELTTPAKAVIIGLMFVGRIGVVTLGLTFVAPKLFQNKQPDDLAV